ncbi:hypothetical protein AVEN_246732-1 [Araneus ventricosus]|uniref:Uncharacterized protein n=1 Tax=Araneus ventricosus TaxID=182803 RepID=A0A4Y2K9W7_ARAVE|nr:hypothetical protein AVEN_246732-1 [Araneus ventricosus]
MSVPDVIPLHLPKKSVLLTDNQRDVQLSRFPFLNLSWNESCQSVRKGDVEFSNGCDSDLLLELDVERWNSKYDLECRCCCCSVCSCKSKQEWSLDGVKFPFDSTWWGKAPDCSSQEFFLLQSCMAFF